MDKSFEPMEHLSAHSTAKRAEEIGGDEPFVPFCSSDLRDLPSFPFPIFRTSIASILWQNGLFLAA